MTSSLSYPGGPNVGSTPLRGRSGFSLIEVMISVAVLALALCAMFGNIMSMHTAHEDEREEAEVQQICNGMIERIMGATFSTLGQIQPTSIDLKQNAWSFQRRATLIPKVWATEFQQLGLNGAPLTQPMNPPMMENVDPTDINYATRDLVQLGLETAPSGLNGLRVYLEYYNVNIFNDLALAAAAGQSPRTAWLNEVGDPTLTDPTTYSYNPPSIPTIPAAANPLTYPTALLSTATPTDIFHPEYSGSFTNGAVAPVEINLVQPVPTDLSVLVARVNDAVLVRILVFWIAYDGGKRWHEVTVIRRNNT